MKLEFHQLDRRHEHLRARNLQRQRQLLASLAASGQQTPIVVVAVPDQPDRYLVIDGYKRIAALQQLARDTVEAVVWPMNEVQALVLDRSLHWSEPESALEEGWLLAELEQRFGYGLEELARQFDRSVSWVSRRLALVELLPDSVQQQVRVGEIPAQVAMKYLVPVARGSLDDCQQLAAAFARHKFTSRQAGQLYAAWRAVRAYCGPGGRISFLPRSLVTPCRPAHLTSKNAAVPAAKPVPAVASVQPSPCGSSSENIIARMAR
jgi:ParB family chromosome partitioning protein